MRISLILRHLRLALLAGAIVVTIAGCSYRSGASRADSRMTVADARHELFEHLRDRAGAASGERSFGTLADLLPNAVDPTTKRPLVDRVVIGTVTAIEPGSGYSVKGDDAPSGTPVAFDSPKALWKTVHLAVSVKAELGGSHAADVSVGLAIGSGMSLDLVRKALIDQGQMVFFLYSGSPVFAEDRNLMAIIGDGTTLAVVGERGKLELPAWSEQFGESSKLLAGVESIARLKEAATISDHPIGENQPQG